MLTLIRTFADCDRATTPVEYALIAAIITLAIVVIISNIGTSLSNEFSEVSSSFK